MNRPKLANTSLAVLLLVPATAWAIGGDDCASATVIPGPFPYTDMGDTCGVAINNWYDESCPNPSASSEVVYTYISPTDQCVNIGLCGATFFDTKLYVYEGLVAKTAGSRPARPVVELSVVLELSGHGSRKPG